jgi:formate hydrogenlyase subunit 6/NADH:ubiquinone oxidoreductase subunit I
MDRAALEGKLTELALRGLVVDVQQGGERYFALAPVLGGIFEFIMMRVREELPAKELARLFDDYLFKDEGFLRQSYEGRTQFARSLIHEERLKPDGDHTEVLDWHRVTKIIESAERITVGLCACRHNKSHLGEACDMPQRTCISLNGGAAAMAQMRISEEIGKAEAMRIVEECKAKGLAQTGDNVKESVTFLCNCCGCCCVLMNAMRHYNMRHAIVSSNWTMTPDAGKCTGCGCCEKACPIQGIDIALKPDGSGKVCVGPGEELCLGCGVCATVCPQKGISMTSRQQRVFTPETGFDKTVQMAIDRGKLADVVFDAPSNLGLHALGRILSALEKSAPGKAALAVKPLRSVYMNALLRLRKS